MASATSGGNSTEGFPAIVSKSLTVTELMFCTITLSALFGSRAKYISSTFKSGNALRLIVLALNVFAIAFAFAAFIMLSDVGVTTSDNACHAAIIVCTFFYVSNKVLMYLFLVERAHAIRAPYKKRIYDKVWLVTFAFVILGFGTITAFAFKWPVFAISEKESRCRIGLHPTVTVPLLAYDIVINIGFTSLFVYLLWPLLAFHEDEFGGAKSSFFSKLFKRKQKDDINQPRSYQYNYRKNTAHILKKLVWKSILGCLFVMCPTVANMEVMYKLNGHEMAWVLYCTCTLDVTWSVMVIYWLTVDPNDVENADVQPKPDAIVTFADMMAQARRDQCCVMAHAERGDPKSLDSDCTSEGQEFAGAIFKTTDVSQSWSRRSTTVLDNY